MISVCLSVCLSSLRLSLSHTHTNTHLNPSQSISPPIPYSLGLVLSFHTHSTQPISTTPNTHIHPTHTHSLLITLPFPTLMICKYPPLPPSLSPASSKPPLTHTSHTHTRTQANALWQRPQTGGEDQFFTQCATDIHKIRPQKREGGREDRGRWREEGERQGWG